MRSNHLMLMVIIALFTIAGGNATRDISEVVGPYNISFSLPNNVEFIGDTRISNGEDLRGINFTEYLMMLEDPLNHNYFINIWIYRSEERLEFISNSKERLSEMVKGYGYTLTNVIDREIDGHNGILVEGYPTLVLPEYHLFTYFVNAQAPVIAVSTLPWDNGTSMMVRTFHVETVE